MKKSRTTQNELEAVQTWIDKKRNENAELESDYKRTKDLKYLVNKIKNCERISMAEKWLAEQRIAKSKRRRAEPSR